MNSESRFVEHISNKLNKYTGNTESNLVWILLLEFYFCYFVCDLHLIFLKAGSSLNSWFNPNPGAD